MSHKRKPKQSPKKRVTPPEPEQITTVDELIEHSNKTGHSYGLFDNEGGWNIWQKGAHFYVAALNRDRSVAERFSTASKPLLTTYAVSRRAESDKPAVRNGGIDYVT